MSNQTATLTSINPILTGDMNITVTEWINRAFTQLRSVELGDAIIFNSESPEIEALIERITPEIVRSFSNSETQSRGKSRLRWERVNDSFENKIRALPCTGSLKEDLLQDTPDDVREFLQILESTRLKRDRVLTILRNSTGGSYTTQVADRSRTPAEFMMHVRELNKRESVTRSMETLRLFSDIKRIQGGTDYFQKILSFEWEMEKLLEMLSNQNFVRYLVLDYARRLSADKITTDIIRNTLYQMDAENGISEELYDKTKVNIQLRANEIGSQSNTQTNKQEDSLKLIPKPYEFKNRADGRKLLKDKDETIYYNLAKSGHSQDDFITEIIPYGYEHYDSYDNKSESKGKTEKSSLFVLDSGASTHLCNDMNLLTDIKNMEENVEIKGIGGNIVVNKVGKILVARKNDKTVYLKNVYYCPTLETNILSVQQLEKDKNFYCKYDKKSGWKVTVNGFKSYVIERIGNMSLIDIKKLQNQSRNEDKKTQSNKTMIIELHNSLGHVNFKTLIELIQSGKLRGTNKKLLDGVKLSELECHSCIKGKKTKAPFKLVDRRKGAPGELLHMDVCGPIHPVSLDRHRYVLNIIDDHTGYMWIKCKQNKSSVAKELALFIPYFKNQFERPIKRFRSDNGTEFVSKEMEKLCVSNGIVQEFTVAYNPASNGVAERNWRTLFNATRCMLIKARAPKCLWSYACRYAASGLNKTLITRSKTELKSNFEMLFGYSPSVQNHYTFGTDIEILISKEKRKSKVYPLTQKGVLLGVDDKSNGFLVLDLVSMNVISARDISVLNTFENVKEADKKLRSLGVEGNENTEENECVTFRKRGRPKKSSTIKPSKHSSAFEVRSTKLNQSSSRELDQKARSRSDETDIEMQHYNEEIRDTRVEDTPGSIQNNQQSDSDGMEVDIENINTNDYRSQEADVNQYRESNEAVIDFISDDESYDNQEEHHKNVSQITEPMKNKLLLQTEPIDSSSGGEIIVREKQNELVQKNSDEHRMVEYIALAKTVQKQKVPESLAEIERMDNKEKSKWKQAMEDEINSLTELDTWEEAPSVPKGQKLIQTKWIFSLKTNSTGEIVRYKARLVARGFSQQKYLNYENTYAPVLGKDSVLMLLSIAVENKYDIQQIDVSTAFVNAELEHSNYITVPSGFKERFSCSVLKLNKALYGLKQSPLQWYNKLSTFIVHNLGFSKGIREPSIYCRGSGESKIIIGVYVDDIIIMGKNNKLLDNVKTLVLKEYKCKDLNRINKFLGLNINYNIGKGQILVSAEEYITNKLNEFGLLGVYPHTSPIGLNFLKGDSKVLDKEKQRLFQQVVGSLRYLEGWIRPDISFATKHLSHYLVEATEFQLDQAIKVMGYLRRTKHFSLVFKPSDGNKEVIEGFTDASYGNEDKRRSVSGGIIKLHGNPIKWWSVRQNIALNSTLESELTALKLLCSRLGYYKEVLLELGFTTPAPTPVHEDNMGLILRFKENDLAKRSKTMEITYESVKDKINRGDIGLHYIKTQEQIADGFTKPLVGEKLEKFLTEVGLKSGLTTA